MHSFCKNICIFPESNLCFKYDKVILPLVLTTTTAQKDDIDLERLVKLYKTAKSVGYDFSKVDFNKVGKQFAGGLKASDIASLKSTNPELSADLEEIIQVAQRQQSGDVEALPVRTKESALAEIAALPVPRQVHHFTDLINYVIFFFWFLSLVRETGRLPYYWLLKPSQVVVE